MQDHSNNLAENTSDEDEVTIASSDTILGQLQRGRGAGFLWALREPPHLVHPILLECIMHDPRCDHQVEVRDDYYARLALTLNLPLEPLDNYLKASGDERLAWSTPLTIETLGRLAELGSQQAVTIMRDYIGYGPKWDYALDMLAELQPREAVEGLDNVIANRFKSGKEMEEASVYGLHGGADFNKLWQDWRASNPAIDHLWNEVEQIEKSYPGPRTEKPDYISFSVEELLDAAGPRNNRELAKIVLSRLKTTDKYAYVSAFKTDNPFAWWVAFQCLDAMKLVAPYYELIFTRAVAYLEQSTWEQVRGQPVIALKNILLRLPLSMTLPLARTWYDSDRAHLDLVGSYLLREHATQEDIPRARSTLVRSMRENLDIYAVGQALEILARIPNIGLLPEVEYVYAETAYSYNRLHASRAMSVNAPALFATKYAYECLWDCEEETRQLACETVDLAQQDALERLQQLAADTYEATSVRDAARRRLTMACVQ